MGCTSKRISEHVIPLIFVVCLFFENIFAFFIYLHFLFDNHLPHIGIGSIFSYIYYFVNAFIFFVIFLFYILDYDHDIPKTYRYYIINMLMPFIQYFIGYIINSSIIDNTIFFSQESADTGIIVILTTGFIVFIIGITVYIIDQYNDKYDDY